MAEFSYKAKDRDGFMVEGEIEAANRVEAVSKLSAKGLFPIAISVKKSSVLRKNVRFSFLGRIKLNDLVVFSRQFATMLKAGLPIVDALRILVEQTENKKLSSIIVDMVRNIEGGETLSEALSRYPRVFSNLYVNMVRAGEASGMLDATFDRLATYLEKELALRRKITGAMFYPVVLVTVSVSVIIFLLNFVIPRFVMILKGLNIPLPLITQKLLNFQAWYEENKLFLGVSVVLVVFSIYLLSRIPSLKLYFDRFKLRIPIFGPLLRKVIVARFSRTLGTLFGAGVPLLDVLDIVARLSNNEVITQAVMRAMTRVREGQPLGQSLEDTAVFPLMVTRMISVGETAGNLEEMAIKVADFFDDEVEAKVATLSSALEPILIIIIGTIVGFIALSVFLPIFNLIGGLSR